MTMPKQETKPQQTAAQAALDKGYRNYLIGASLELIENPSEGYETIGVIDANGQKLQVITLPSSQLDLLEAARKRLPK